MAKFPAVVLGELPFFPNDTNRVPARVNRLNNQALVSVYLKESARFE